MLLLLLGNLVFLLFGSVTGFVVPTVGFGSGRQTIQCWEKPTWLDDAMNVNVPSLPVQEEVLTPGIAGFAMDPELGFVSLLVANNNNVGWVPVVVSSVDKDRLQSPEAFTCVQLAGGIDLGTAVLPPDALAQLVADEQDYHNDDYPADVQDLRSRISLAQVQVVAATNTPKKDKDSTNKEEDVTYASTPERDQAMQETLPKVYKAVQSLPGLNEATSEQVSNAMQRFANAQGMVDRDAFSNILEQLRAPPTTFHHIPIVAFGLTVNLIRADGDGMAQVLVETTNAMLALGLAMRYQVTVQVADECCGVNDAGMEALRERFPAFRPIKDLNEDAKTMDGFMFGTAKKTLDNDMKQ